MKIFNTNTNWALAEMHHIDRMHLYIQTLAL